MIFNLYFFLLFLPDSFVNSQEWTLSRGVPDIRLGIVGSLSSGKSALVHRYLTGSYMQEESPEGGRFKKEVVVDGQSYLLLIRDEGGPPELQVRITTTYLLIKNRLNSRLISPKIKAKRCSRIRHYLVCSMYYVLSW